MFRRMTRPAAPGSGPSRWRHRGGLAGCLLVWGLSVVSPGETTAAPGAAAPQTPVAELEVIGSSYVTGGVAPSTTPIYSLVIGDPRPDEGQAYVWSSRFGMYALDAILWTREQPDSQERWLKTTLRLPRTVEEVVMFFRVPETFKAEIPVDTDDLPVPFHHLEASALAALDYIVSYRAGGTRVPLRVGVTADQAATVLREARRAAEVPR